MAPSVSGNGFIPGGRLVSKMTTFIVLLVLSVGLGLGLGEWFFRLYLEVVPPVAVGNFNRQSAHVAFLAYGLGAGVLMFLWALVGMFSTRIMKTGTMAARV
jgi:hypothetical protein